MKVKDHRPFEVIFDAGASKTYFYDCKHLINFQYKRSKIMLGNETTITYYWRGDKDIHLNLSYVPDLRMNLLTTENLCIDNDFSINFNKKRAQVIHRTPYILRELNTQS
jgi:hypothetical protein